MVFGVILLCVAAYGTYLPSDTCNVWCKSLTWAGFVVMTWTWLYFGISAYPRDAIMPCCDGRASCECDGKGELVSHAYTTGEVVDILCLPCTFVKALFCWPYWVFECLKKKWGGADELTEAKKQIAALTSALAERIPVPSAPPSGDPKESSV